MFYQKKMITMASFMAFVIIGTTIAKQPAQKERNLKVLPKDISDQKLDSIMHSYNKALGVSCDFCHTKQLVADFGTDPNALQFESDKNPMKENARDMMRMVIEMNKKYFYFDKAQKEEYLTTINCNMCHQGKAMPPEFH